MWAAYVSATRPQVVLALDISVRSPGVAILVRSQGTARWHLYCIAQRQREAALAHRGTIPCADSIDLRVFEAPAGDDDMSKYARVMEMVRVAARAAKAYAHDIGASNVTCLLEGYAFVPSQRRGFNYKIHEVTGVVKTVIHQELGDVATSVSPVTWKRGIALNAGCSKRDVYHAVQSTVGHDLGILQALMLPSTGHVMCPANDVADAMGIALYYVLRQPKRRRNDSCGGRAAKRKR